MFIDSVTWRATRPSLAPRLPRDLHPTPNDPGGGAANDSPAPITMTCQVSTLQSEGTGRLPS